MGGARKPDVDWLRQRLSTLSDRANELATLAETTQSFNPWAVLKLGVLSASLNVYTRIAGNRFDDIYYVDAMAGAGTFTTGDLGEPMVGSPILAATLPDPDQKWTKMFLIERDEDRAAALEHRLKYAVQEFEDTAVSVEDIEVIPGDANDVLPTIPDKIRSDRGCIRGAHHFAFIDNEGMDVTFDAVTQLSEMYNDLLIHYPTTMIKRTHGKGTEDDAHEDIAAFTGVDTQTVLSQETGADCSDLYADQLCKIDRPEHRRVTVESRPDIPYEYDLWYAARETSGGNPWMNSLDRLDERLSKLDGEDVNRVLDTIFGDNTALTGWIEEPDESPEERRDEDQRGLSGFS